MKRLNFFIAAVSAIFAVACTNEPDVPDSLTSEAADIVFPGIGGEEPVTFSVNTDWMITSDKTWVDFDADNGAAGDVTVMMSVGQNPDEKERTAVVTIVAGTQKIEFTVGQNAYRKNKETFDVFNREQVFTYTVDSELIGVTISDDAKSWISEAESADDKVVSLKILANAGGAERTAIVTINTEDSENILTINQIEVIEMQSAEVTFLGNKVLPYDPEAYDYTTFDEYFIELTGNGASVNIAVNAADSDVIELPEGTYRLDNGGVHAAGTFSVNNEEQYYTSLMENGQYKNIIDGEIVITKDGENYKIRATLYDEAQISYKYSYEGKIENITKDDFGIQVYEASFKGAYNTYFTSKANEYSLTVVASAAPDEGSDYLSWFDLTFFAEGGEISDPVFPVGTFTFNEPQEDESVKYPNGGLNAVPNTFSGYANSKDQSVQYQFTGGTVTVSSDADGKYSLKFENVTYDIMKKESDDTWDYTVKDGSGTYSTIFEALDIEVSDTAGTPLPDESFVFAHIFSNYPGLYYGDTSMSIAGTRYPMDNLFMFDLTSFTCEYKVHLILNSTKDWAFEVNFGKSYCKNPLPEGKYTFVGKASEGAENPNVNAKGHDVILNTAGCNVENGYTGTKALITGGSVTVDASGFELDLESSVLIEASGDRVNLDVPLKFTGRITASTYYWRDYRGK